MTVNRAGAFHKRMWNAVFWVNYDLSSFLHSRLQVRVYTALYWRKVQLFCMCYTSRWCFCTEVWNLLVDPTERANRLCPLLPRVSQFLPSDSCAQSGFSGEMTVLLLICVSLRFQDWHFLGFNHLSPILPFPQQTHSAVSEVSWVEWP